MTHSSKKRFALLACLLLALTGCGGTTPDNGNGTTTPPGSGGSGGGSNGGTDQSTVRFGSFDNGGNFNEGDIEANQTSLNAGDSTTLTVSLIDENGVPVTEDPAPGKDKIEIFFSSSCINNGLSEVDPAVATNNSGTVDVTYTARGCDGSDLVTAQTSVNGNTLSASITLQTKQAPLGSIQFKTAEPQVIGIQGSGSLPGQSKVTFMVTNDTGGPVQNQQVDFSLNTTVGGITLNHSQSTTNNSGLVSTTVNAGTQATTVRVTAKATQGSKTSQAQSSALAITTGIPDNDSFSISATSLNIEGLQRDGEETQINILAADRFNNPVPDGTAINFTTEGGSIDGSCTTTDGGCSVTLKSQNPRPADGRVTVLATAIGEESFADTNPSNGRYDDGESFTDLPEAFRDDNFDGIRQSGEPFLDFNSNAMFDGPSGTFEGLLCKGPSKCGADTLNVRESIEIVFAASDLSVNVTPNPIDLNSGAVDVTISVQGPNGQRPPEGTTVVARTTQGNIVDSDAGFGVSRTFTQKSTNAPGPSTFELTLEPTVDGDGTLSVTTTTPNNVVSQGSAAVDQTP